MLSTLITVTLQVMVLFLLMSTGFYLTKRKIITKKGTKQMTDILLMFVTVSVVINSFSSTKFDTGKLTYLLIMAIFAVAIHIAGLVIGLAISKKSTEKSKSVICTAVIFSNAGYMGVPLTQAVVGASGVFYSAVYITVFNIFLWTVGVVLFSPKNEKLSIKKVLINPGTIGILIGLPIFLLSGNDAFINSTFMDFSQKYILYAPGKTIEMLSWLNTPLAMIIIGSQIAGVDFKTFLQDKRVLLVSAIRLILIPALFFVPIALVANDFSFAAACIISASAPCATVTSLFAAKYRKDTEFAAKAVAFSTLCSILTMPVFVTLMKEIIH